ncbi:unnamed protein product [Lactuca saligna]|uniref:Uncharacterized protein n=1 Tax=Lactuca saligna TaxID=75948 RepID=A0AA35YAJ5_LACSI|nr:unnamed protein product [Lactuca saligna]
METFIVGESSLSERDVCDIIAKEISRFMREDMPRLISFVMEEMISMIYERLRVLQADLEAGRLMTQKVFFRELDTCGAPCFFEGKDHIINMRCIIDMESTFCVNFYPEEANVRFATCILCDRARESWCEVVQNLELGEVESMTYEYFVTKFKREFVLSIKVQQLTQENLAL